MGLLSLQQLHGFGMQSALPLASLMHSLSLALNALKIDSSTMPSKARLALRLRSNYQVPFFPESHE